MILSLLTIISFVFSTCIVDAQKNVVAGLLPTISCDSMPNKTNSSRIYITDGVDFDTLPARVNALLPERWISNTNFTLPVYVDFTFPTATLSSVDVYSGWYEYAGAIGNGGQFTNMEMQTFDGFAWNDLPADTTRSYEGLHKKFTFITPVTTNQLRLSINQLAASASGRIRIDEIKVWSNTTGLIPIKALAALNIYPNPVKNTLNVYLNNQSNIRTIEIINLTGTVLKSQQVNGTNSVSIDMSKFLNGVYICRCNDGFVIQTAKVVKE